MIDSIPTRTPDSLGLSKTSNPSGDHGLKPEEWNRMADTVIEFYKTIGVDGTTDTQSLSYRLSDAERQAALPKAEGPKGVTGPMGAPGPIGSKGEKGDQGAPGSNGAVGPVGPKGVKGEPGDVGPQGEQGPVGSKGARGDDGGVSSYVESVFPRAFSWLSSSSFSRTEILEGAPVWIDIGRGLVGGIVDPTQLIGILSLNGFDKSAHDENWSGDTVVSSGWLGMWKEPESFVYSRGHGTGTALFLSEGGGVSDQGPTRVGASIIQLGWIGERCQLDVGREGCLDFFVCIRDLGVVPEPLSR